MEKNILIVDNELSVRDLLYDAFLKAGYAVTTATGGEQALVSLRAARPALVLLDFRMPDISGIEVLKKMRAIDSKVRVVMFTGVGDEELEKEARLAGASGFLKKGLGVEVIIKAVNDICASPAAYSQQTVLVVDDDPGISSLIKEFLQKKGFSVATASSGEEAISFLEKEKPILILLDVNLPGMDGIVTLKRIRQLDEKIGVIMITGVKNQDVFEEAQKLGAYDYIVKPFTLDYLETIVMVRICLVSAQL